MIISVNNIEKVLSFGRGTDVIWYYHPKMILRSDALPAFEVAASRSNAFIPATQGLIAGIFVGHSRRSLTLMNGGLRPSRISHRNKRYHSSFVRSTMLINMQQISASTAVSNLVFSIV